MIVVLSKQKAERFKSNKPWACISISGNPDDIANIDEENRVGLLRLHFHDIESYQEGCFEKEHAQEILNFFENVKDKIDTLMIHCRAGISRSSATAAALTKLYGDGDLAEYFYSGRYAPNMLVFTTILEVAKEKE